MNVSVIRGRMVAVPPLRRNDEGTGILKFTVAVNEYGGKNKRAEFIDCTAFGSCAEFIERNFVQGKMICICGKIRTHVWEKRDGVKAKDVWLEVAEAQFG